MRDVQVVVDEGAGAHPRRGKALIDAAVDPIAGKPAGLRLDVQGQAGEVHHVGQPRLVIQLAEIATLPLQGTRRCVHVPGLEMFRGNPQAARRAAQGQHRQRGRQAVDAGFQQEFFEIGGQIVSGNVLARSHALAVGLEGGNRIGIRKPVTFSRM